MKTGKKTKPVTFLRKRLFHCAGLLFLMSIAVLRAEERLTAVWSNHLAELNQRVPAGFVVVVQPFVVIGSGVVAPFQSQHQARLQQPTQSSLAR